VISKEEENEGKKSLRSGDKIYRSEKGSYHPRTEKRTNPEKGISRRTSKEIQALERREN